MELTFQNALAQLIDGNTIYCTNIQPNVLGFTPISGIDADYLVPNYETGYDGNQERTEDKFKWKNLGYIVSTSQLLRCHQKGMRFYKHPIVEHIPFGSKFQETNNSTEYIRINPDNYLPINQHCIYAYSLQDFKIYRFDKDVLVKCVETIKYENKKPEPLEFGGQSRPY